MVTMPTCDIYLRLSDARVEEAFEGREAKCRAFATAIGWTVHRVVTENDVFEDGRPKPASAWKRRKIRTPSGKVERRVIRPGFREILDDIATGRVNALLGEDLDRIVRDPRDMEDLLDICEMTKASVRSISGSIKITEGGDENERYIARIMVAGASKASGDTSRRVVDSRERWYGKSYFGGPRPYGFLVAQNTEQYQRTLIIVPDEADILREAADDILNKDIPPTAKAKELRERGIPNAHGNTNWSTNSLKHILTKPAIAGLAAYKGRLTEAPWDAILERDIWERLCARLNDPSRRTKGVEPRWLLTGIAECGRCNNGATVRATGRHDNSFYSCRECYRIKRRTRQCDTWVERNITAYLSQSREDIGKPEPRPDIDRVALQAEEKKLLSKKASLSKMYALGEIDDDDLLTGSRVIRDRLSVIKAQLAQSNQPDPIPEFRGRHAHTRQIWQSLSLARKRAILRKFVTVTILPTAVRGARPFDPGSVRIVVKETGNVLDVRQWEPVTQAPKTA